MPLRAFDVVGVCAVVTFCTVVVVDLGALSRPREEIALEVEPEALAAGFREGVEWHGLYREGARVGFSRLERRLLPDGFRLVHYSLVSGSMMGQTEPLELTVTTDLTSAFALRSFDVHAQGALLDMVASGEVLEDHVVVQIEGMPSGAQSMRIPLQEPPVFDFSLEPMLMRQDLSPGDRFTFTHFDPMTLASRTGAIEYLGRDDINVLGEKVETHHLRQEVSGQLLHSWVNDLGEVLREELPLGLVAQRESEAEATYGFARAEDGP